jgi:hypothetical protein
MEGARVLSVASAAHMAVPSPGQLRTDSANRGLKLGASQFGESSALRHNPKRERRTAAAAAQVYGSQSARLEAPCSSAQVEGLAICEWEPELRPTVR